jgi:ParB-like chromosome segregation protein Spo0J
MPSSPPLEVRTLPLSAVTPAGYNPRQPLAAGSPAYRKLRRSLERFGLVEPLVWNQRSGTLVGGHARLAILAELGFTEVPVAVVDLDPAGEKALNVVLNNPAAQGRFDGRRLTAVLEELAELDALADSGFDPAALRTLRLDPADDPAPPPEGRVEVTLVCSPDAYAGLEPDLDALVAKHRPEVHVRRC